MISDPLFYWFGRRYGDDAIRWMERKLGRGRRAGALGGEGCSAKPRGRLVALMPNNIICLLAGATGMAWAAFAIVNVTGTLVRILGVRFIGSAFSEPILAFNGWIGDHRLVLTALTFGHHVPADRPQRGTGRDPIETPAELGRGARGRGTRSQTSNDGGVTNVLGGALEPCGFDPLTGFYRDGCCSTGGDDPGVHVVCARMTAEFLAFSQAQGNDLSTRDARGRFPRPASPAIAGACARRAGRKRWRPASRRRSTSRRPTSRRWSGARSTPCATTRSTNPVAPDPEARPLTGGGS